MRMLAMGATTVALTFAINIDIASAQIVDGPTVEWRHSNWGKRRANTEGIEKINAILKERTGGKFTIKIGYGEMFSKDKENLDSIKLNAIEMADMCNFYHPGKNPAWMVFSLPFLPYVSLEASAEAADAMLKHPLLVADMAQWNAMPYFFTILPQYEFMGKGKPPKTLDDWKGLRVRAPGAVGEAFVKLGASLSTVPAVELYTALERGTVDAASFPFTYAHAAYQLNTISNWYTSNLAPGNCRLQRRREQGGVCQAAAAVSAVADGGAAGSQQSDDRRLPRGRQDLSSGIQAEADRDQVLGR